MVNGEIMFLKNDFQSSIPLLNKTSVRYLLQLLRMWRLLLLLRGKLYLQVERLIGLLVLIVLSIYERSQLR
ncbi:hypothetical protein ACHQM5_025216 [Ranunculus cassubicifolius]